MYADIQRLLQIRRDLFWEGRYADLTKRYSLPFVVYYDGVPTYISTLEQATHELSCMAKLMAEGGVSKVEPEVVSVELPKNGRFRVWSGYSAFDAKGITLAEWEVLQYFRACPSGPLVQMKDVKGCPFTSLALRNKDIA